MSKKIPTRFVGEIVGEPIQINPEISKARLRIFYKGLNRNNGFITDEFAEKLLSSLPYTPVVGIYNSLTKEFGGHAEDRNVANMYGVVPQNPALTWEDNLDKDGILRTYACCDVYLYTGRYDAAKQIIGKQHSMELDEKTIQGDWRVIDAYGTEAYVYTDARFIGLCVLGDNKEPCFEGSAFFELVSKFSNFMTENTSNGGKLMAVEKKKDQGVESASFESTKEKENFVEDENKDPKEEKKEETPADSEKKDEETPADSEKKNEEETPADSEKKEEDTPVDSEKKEEETPADSEKKEEEDVPADSATEETPKEEEDKKADSACNPKKDSACDPDKKDSACNPKKEYEEVKKEPDDKGNEPADDPDDEDGDDDDAEDDMSDSALTAKNFEKLNNKILELESKLSTYETEANKFKGLYTALKADYDILVTEKNKDLVAQKKAKVQEYSLYLSAEVKEDFESRLDSYSTVDELEKDLLFAAKPTLFANRENFAPTSTYEEEETDELAAFIKKNIKH